VATVILQVSITGKSFRRDGETLPVLQAVDLSLGEREIVALSGPSGCGKTTLLRIIGGLDTDFTGAVRWPAKTPPRIGTVFQEPRLLPWRTVRQNLLLVQVRPDTALADDLLDALELTPFRDTFPPALSLGMARRVAIARAFAIRPEVVLLDEPFVSLDPPMAERSRTLLLEAWRSRPTAAILVTHDLAEAAALADRIVVLGARPTRVVGTFVVPEASRRKGIETGRLIADMARGMDAR
jgi:NitT/TauT family transport system ATP-binding protein